MALIEFEWLYYLSAALALAVGWLFFRSRSSLPVEDRLLAGVVPLGTLTLAWLLLRSLFVAPHMIHNGIRLAPTFALMNGYQLYYGLEDGPALCTVYGPIMYLVYLPATLAASPTTAVMIAELIVQFCFWVPLFAIQLMTAWDRPQRWILALAAIVCCGYLTFRSEPMFLSAIWVHADAPALAFAVCACGLLYFGRTPYSHWTLSACAFLVGLSVWTKFSMATVPFALLLYVGLAHGRASCLNFFFHLAAWGLAMSSALLLAFGPAETIYNTLTLVAKVPWKSGGTLAVLFDATRELVRDILPFGVVLIAYIWWQVQARANRPDQGWRDWLRDNRWTIFLIVGLFSVPLCIRLRGRFGGGENSFTPAIYFLLAATTLAMLQKRQLSMPSGQFVESTTKVLAAILVGAFVLLVAPGPKELHGTMSKVRFNGSEIAFEYLKRNPGKTYFTDDPLPALMAQGQAYHFSYGILMRDMVGDPLSTAEFYAQVPPNMEVVCFAPDATVIDQGTAHPVLRFIPEYARKAPSDQLSFALAKVGWTTFQRR